MFKVPEQHRVKKGKLASAIQFGNNGCFAIPAKEVLYNDKGEPYQQECLFICIAAEAKMWQMVSICVQRPGPAPRYPTYDEIKAIRNLFWHGDKDNVFTYYPSATEFKEDRAMLVQLFCKPGFDFPVPSDEMMGLERKGLIEKITGL